MVVVPLLAGCGGGRGGGAAVVVIEWGCAVVGQLAVEEDKEDDEGDES